MRKADRIDLKRMRRSFAMDIRLAASPRSTVTFGHKRLESQSDRNIMIEDCGLAAC